MTRNAIVFTLLALVAGGAAGFLVGQGATPAPPAVLDDSRESDGEGWRPADDLSRSVPSARRDDGPGLEVPTGDGVITGRVASKSGEGIAGVTVRAAIAALPAMDHDGSPPAAGRDVEDLVRAARLAHASRRETMTAEDGSFRLGSLADRPYRVEAFKRGLTLESNGADRARPGQIVNFVAKPRLLLTVTVRGPGGGMPAEAELMVQSRGGRRPPPFGYPGMRGGRPRSWTPDRRGIALGPGTYELSAAAGLHGEMRSEPVTVSIHEGQEPEEVVLELESRPGVRGRVRYEDGVVEASSGITVTLVNAAADAEPDQMEFRQGRRVNANAGSGLAYVIPDVEPGDYWVGALVNWQLRAQASVTVREGLVEKDLVVPAPGPGETFVARVLGPDGRPVKNATFGLTIQKEGGSNNGLAVATAVLPDDSYRLRPGQGRIPGSKPAGRAFLRVHTPDLGVEEIEIDLAALTPVTVAFKKAGTLRVRLEGGTPELIESLNVSVTRLSDQGHGIQAFHDRRPKKKEPVRIIEGLQPGRYRLNVSVRTGYRYLPLEEREITVGSGESGETILVPPLHELTVTIENEEIRYFQLHSEGQQWGGHLQRPSKGPLVIKHLPAGQYGLTAWTKDGSIGMTVTVPAQRAVLFEGRSLNALRVRIKKEDGLLFQGGFRAGDLVVGVNGETFENDTEREAKMMLASQKTPARFQVIRGSRRLEISFDASALQKRQPDLGGWLEPAAR